ncbi:MAG TPA: protein-glutamate O-methyltransferase CheR [Longimicrobium sp.]|jgi:chemotaxis methyl-accepting protein methylase|nr:protein-glutamate O-methyltransferase CheR [Longimicrobium sp.]
MSGLTPPPPYVPFALPLEGDDEELEKLKRKIERDRGFNCSFYKDKCLRRRIAVRMRARGRRSFAEYHALLEQEPGEYEQLLDTLTINVTKFFRNPETWEAVEAQVVPHLFAAKGPIRVWSAGSASGEEAYTVSILLQEWAEKHRRVPELERVRIVGTDIDRRSLENAERGVYPDLSLTETPARVRGRWFSEGPPFRIRPEAQRGVSFTRRDLISERAEAGQSLIFCRNVVIYFDREIQERLFKDFFDALVPGGFLVLGKVETLIGVARTLFRPVNNRERIFQKPA